MKYWFFSASKSFCQTSDLVKSGINSTDGTRPADFYSILGDTNTR